MAVSINPDSRILGLLEYLNEAGKGASINPIQNMGYKLGAGLFDALVTPQEYGEPIISDTGQSQGILDAGKSLLPEQGSRQSMFLPFGYDKQGDFELAIPTAARASLEGLLGFAGEFDKAYNGVEGDIEINTETGEVSPYTTDEAGLVANGLVEILTGGMLSPKPAGNALLGMGGGARRSGEDVQRLYRGLENKYNPLYDTAKSDAPSGYSTWTDNPDLAKQYAGDSGYVYYIDLPKSKIREDVLDQSGERALYYNNKKHAGLNNISGDEYLVYQDHELFDPSNVKSTGDTLNAGGKGIGILNAGSKVARSGREVPAAIGVEEPITRGDLLSNVYPRPLQEMEAKYLDRKELLPKKILTPEDLEGQASVKAYGDRTDAGLDLIEINGQKLDEAVRLLGGKDYMRSLAQQIDGSSWASAASKISLLSNEIARLRRQGFDTNLMYTAMAGASDKFSNMLSEAVVNQMPYSKILKKDAKVFDTIMQDIIDAHNAALKKDQSKIPKWVGIHNKNLKQYLNDGGGTALRVPFINEISKRKWYDKGFPDIASTRFAITSPDLVHANTLDSGHVISSTTGKVLKDMKTIHPSYPQGIEGVLSGGLEIPLPAHIAWKDWMTKRFPEHHKAGLLSEVKFLPKDLMSFDYSAVSQKHTPEWVDEAMEYTEMMKKYR
jgi:hypothetical protein